MHAVSPTFSGDAGDHYIGCIDADYLYGAVSSSTPYVTAPDMTIDKCLQECELKGSFALAGVWMRNHMLLFGE